MNIKDYNKEKHNITNRQKKDNVNKPQNSTNNRKRNKKKKFRLDKLIGYITIMTIIIFSGIIYNDIKSAGKTIEKESIAEAGKQLSTTSTTSALTANDSAKSKKKVICIDAGHGGIDGGAQYNNYSEKEQTLELSKLIQDNLEAQGYTVIMTRTTDVDVSLEKRLEIAKKANADILISVHRNYYKSSTSVSGVEAWINSTSPSDAKTLANDILGQLAKNCSIVNRGVKTGTIENANTNYYLNSKSPCTSCIIELGFITNTTDNTLVTKNKSLCAKAIAQGIINYINELEKKNVTN